jgi:hypothetical protein
LRACGRLYLKREGLDVQGLIKGEKKGQAILWSLK